MSKQEELEERIREQRIVEANKKGLMGQNGKIGIVLKVLGSPIIRQSEGGIYVDTNYFNINQEEKEIHNISDPVELMSEIPIMGIENNNRPNSKEWYQYMPDPINYGIDTIGLHFDGLNRGMHLEIKYDELSSELILYYKGYVAYREIKGELLGYSPNEEWEKWMNHLYKISKDKLRKIKEEEFEETIKQNEKNKINWWNSIKEKWGIN